MRRGCPLVLRLLLLLDGGVWSLRNLSISVPRAALSGEGRAAVLRCDYELEGAALYSIRWYQADTEFYRFVPREMPPYMVFPLPGASVDLTQSNENQVRIVNLNRRLSGLYQCEVSGDAPLFHTEIRGAPLTVVDPPFRAPRLATARATYSRGDIIRANCSVDEAYPTPNITWLLDDHMIAESVSPQNAEMDFKENAAFSLIEISVLEGVHYKVGLSYTSASLAGAYGDLYGHDGDGGRTEEDTVLRYALAPPAGAQFILRCAARIFDVYERRSEPVLIREDAPRPASVTGDDSSAAVAACSGVLAAVCACAVLLTPRAAL